MPYSSSLTDEEWMILEPLLPQILPRTYATGTVRSLFNSTYTNLI
ncbi:hypothetical protein [Nostoc sp.]